MSPPAAPARTGGLGLRVAAALVGWLLRALARSWRIEYRGDDPFRANRARCGVVAVSWHRNLLVGAGLFRDSGIHVPVSRSRDGERISAVMSRLGLGAPPRGSTSRGGSAALKAMVGLLRSGRPVALLADGPRGPERVAKAGVITLARLCGEKVHPIALAAAPSIRFRSWDRTLLPLPFARVICHFGPPFALSAGQGSPSRKADADALGGELEALTRALDAELGLS